MRCLALFTGGLDSQIAARMMQRQGIDVVAVHVQTPFTLPTERAAAVAGKLGIEFHAIDWRSDYLSLLHRPRFGFAEAMAPCLDCRSGMLQRVKTLLVPLGASFLVSGEIVGQRPSSLRSRDLETIDFHGQVEDLLLRPLSALLLRETLPERQGWVDRGLLHGWHGKGRKDQLRLARDWDLSMELEQFPRCKLLETGYAARLKHLLRMTPEPPAWQLGLLALGRHFGLADGSGVSAAHLIVSKNAAEGNELRRIVDHATANAVLLEPLDFRGPVALLAGEVTPRVLDIAASVIAKQAKGSSTDNLSIRYQGCGSQLSLAGTHPIPSSDQRQHAVPWS